eukprot:TRINITY_DN12695_c0_g1_i1.p1 TRINITY_DN12695_c0_g1~~TRINITY_DN12695_c0_g1_i1.p1  ORF type:complete len:440 (+),score=115.68 TRINITY_DN12695_c0_g1_i1:104-1423(+)
MDELYRVGERVAQERAAALGPGAGDGQPSLEDLLGGGADIEQYLQSYEQMLQDGIGQHGPKLNEVDAEGGVTVRPEPGFVIKTRDTRSGMKIFMNVVSNEHVEAPHMKSLAEYDGEEGCRVPLSIGTPVEDFDKKKEPCVTYDIVANPTVVEECKNLPQFRESVVQLCMAALAQKYKIELDPKYKLPKMNYKGDAIQLQRIRVKKDSQIQEVGASAAPQPQAGKRSAGEAEEGEDAQGPKRPDFRVFYSLPASENEAAEAAVPDGFSLDFRPLPENLEEWDKIRHVSGFDLPCYRIVAFDEKFRGTMKNKAEQQKAEAEKAALDEEERQVGLRETRRLLRGRTCVVQVRMSALDRNVPALKQFGVEISDECMRLNFPLLPRMGRSAHAPLTLWWPRPHFCSAQAVATWSPSDDTLTVQLPTEPPAAAGEFDEELLDAVF